MGERIQEDGTRRMIILGCECNSEGGFHVGNGGLVRLFRGEIPFLNLLVLLVSIRFFFVCFCFSLFHLVRSLLLFFSYSITQVLVS